MARIRTIKPDFWTDGTMISLSFEARLFYIGTWNFALCDHGHLPDDALGLKLKILPADNVNPQALLDELISAGRINRITLHDGRSFLHILRLDEHQKVDARWQSRCPVCTALTETHASSHEAQGDSGHSAGTRRGGEGVGKERKGGEGNRASAAPAVDNSEPPLRCAAHLTSERPPACGLCKDARVAHEAWKLRQGATVHHLPSKPSRLDPAVYCEHAQFLGQCEICAYEARKAAEILTARFGDSA